MFEINSILLLCSSVLKFFRWSSCLHLEIWLYRDWCNYLKEFPFGMLSFNFWTEFWNSIDSEWFHRNTTQTKNNSTKTQLKQITTQTKHNTNKTQPKQNTTQTKHNSNKPQFKQNTTKKKHNIKQNTTQTKHNSNKTQLKQNTTQTNHNSNKTQLKQNTTQTKQLRSYHGKVSFDS